MKDKTTSIRDPAESADVERIRRMIANPYYCIRVDPRFCEEHPLIMSEEQFIKAGITVIKDVGVEAYMRHLLANLKGEYV